MYIYAYNPRNIYIHKHTYTYIHIFSFSFILISYSKYSMPTKSRQAIYLVSYLKGFPKCLIV